jgi:hypothetical protein
MGYYYTTVYTKSGNVWIAKCSSVGYHSWKRIYGDDDDDFLSGKSDELRYNESPSEEYSLGVACSHKDFMSQIY